MRIALAPSAFSACLTAATRYGKQLHGRSSTTSRSTSAARSPRCVRSSRRPTAVAALDKGNTGGLERAKLPGSPVSVEVPLGCDPS